MNEVVNPIDGTRISFDVAESNSGGGTPVVLAHGSALSRAIWRGLGYTRAIREEHRVIALDLRGHGRSGKPTRAEDYRMHLVVADVLAVLDELGIDRAHFMGYSFGARLGFALAADHADRLLSLVSLAGTYRATAGSVGEVFFPDYDTALADGGMPEFLRRWTEWSGGEIDAQTTAAFLANDGDAIRAYFHQVEREPGLTDAQLPSIRTPSLLIAGTDDRSRLVDSARAASLMPDARFESLPGRAHGTTLSPAAEVLDLVLPFWRAVDEL